MPELPEVESVARTLSPLVRGRKIRAVHVFHPIATKPQPPSRLVNLAQGQRIRIVDRKGKYLLLRLDTGLIEIHFRFDGQLIWFHSAKELFARANQPTNPKNKSASSKAAPPDGVHVDVALELDKGVLGFSDRRHFGRVHFWESFNACPGLKRLGVDALSRDFTPARLAQLAAKSKLPLKLFLLDQTRVAGIGNIYSSESLWHARLDPRRRANSLTTAEARRLHKAIVSVLDRVLECCLHPAPDFRDPAWWFQGLEKVLRAYQRKGEPCRRCGEEILRIEQGGRSTYFCANCQS